MSRNKIIVDKLLCQGHGVCEQECPEVFTVEVSETGYSKVKLLQEIPPEDLLVQVQDAVEYCPNRVLSLVELD